MTHARPLHATIRASAAGLIALCVAAPAAAQYDVALTVRSGFVIDADADPSAFYAAGVGSPAVTYDAVADEFVMFFSTRLDTDDPTNCPLGRWGIGRATSTDGVAWTVDTAPLLQPGNLRASSREWEYDDCVLAHPNILIDDDGTWKLWYKTHPRRTACTDETSPWQEESNEPPWGCPDGDGFISGIGYATSVDSGATFQVQDRPYGINIGPVIASPSASYPSVIKYDNVYLMTFQELRGDTSIYDLFAALSLDGFTWTVDPAPSIVPGFANWINDQIVSPNLLCDANDDYPREMWVAGRRSEGGSFVESGIGRAFNVGEDTFFPWDPGSPFITFSAATAWRQVSVIEIGDEYLVYFAQRDGVVNHVGVASTDSGILDDFADGADPAARTARAALVRSRVCETIDTCPVDTDAPLPAPLEEPTPLSRPPAASSSSESPASTSDATVDETTSAACAHTNAPAGALALSLGLLAASRRRRAR